MGIDSSVFVWARTKSVCAKLGWSHCYESLTHLNKKCCGRLNRDWIRSSQPSPCVFKILFILLQIHKVNKTREHLTSTGDKCLQCSRFFLILPSTPCSNVKASKIIYLKYTLNKCFLIKNSLHISVQPAELCWCSRYQNLRWVILNTSWQIFWKYKSLVICFFDWGKQRILRRVVFRFVDGKTT